MRELLGHQRPVQQALQSGNHRMASCAHCRTAILFGGKRHGGLRYCNQDCVNRSGVEEALKQIPLDEVMENAWEVHQGRCHRCKGEGPNDVYTSHRIASLTMFTFISSDPLVCCVRCGRRARLISALFCALCGWWGFPGFFATPFYIWINLAGAVRMKATDVPSEQLETMVRLRMWQAFLEEVHASYPRI